LKAAKHGAERGDLSFDALDDALQADGAHEPTAVSAR